MAGQHGRQRSPGAADNIRNRIPRSAAERSVPLSLVIPALVVGGLMVVLGPALVGRGVLLDVNSLSGRLPFRAMTDAVYADAIACRKDTIDYFPAIAQIRHSLFAGDLPMWAPYEVGGAPLASQPYTGYLSPLALPYFLLPLWLAPAFVKLAEVVVAVTGTIAFLRRRGISWAGSWLAAFVFVTSGFMIMWTNWPQTRVAALIPLLMWATDKVVQHHRARDAVVLALVFAAMLFGGFPAVTLFALTVAGVYAMVRVWVAYRQRPWEAVGILATAAGGLSLGLGLAAVQMVPFVENLAAAMSERDKGGEHLPLSAALTLLAPAARGTCRGGVWYGDVIPIEAVGYVGGGALVLAVFALGFRRRRHEEPGIRPWLLGTVIVAAVLIWVGGPLLAVWQQLPVIGNNSITRAQSVVGFLIACLVGLGFDRVTHRLKDPEQRCPTTTSDTVDRSDDRDGPVDPTSKRPQLTFLVAVVVLTAVTVAAVVAAHRGGYLGHLAGSVVVPFLFLVGALAALRSMYAGPRWLGSWAPLTLAVLIVVQGTLFAKVMLPLSQREMLYPETPTHQFLQDHIGHSRYGAGDGTMEAAISDWYQLRSPTGHDFTDPRWKDLLAAVDPDVQRTVTFSAFSSTLPFERVSDSTILDRLAVRYWTADPRRPVGDVERVAGDGLVQLTANNPASCSIDGGPVRGIMLHLPERVAVAEDGGRPLLQVRVTVGEETRTGSVLVDGSALGPGNITVAVAGEDLSADGQAEVWVSLAGTAEPLYLSGEGRQLACSAVRPTGDTDRVRLRFADAGGAIYERLDALPRIRWASQSRVVDPARQVAALQEGMSDDTVLLDSDATPAAQGGHGSVRILSDDGERITVEAESTRQGYLVVADSIVRPGWTASVDGDPAPLVRADHALAAVPVPAGTHRVELAYNPPGLRLGAVVSAVSLLTMAALLVTPILRRRRRGDRSEVSAID